jgi:hypothetical protein
MKIIEWHWEGDDIIATNEAGEVWRLVKPYWSGVSFGELESSEEVTIELTMTYEKT